MSDEWEYMARVHCPSCGGFTLWGGGEHAAYCVRCEVRVVLEVFSKATFSAMELEELARVRYLAGVDSNSAVGAFG